jgi:multidrug efflux system membrane fusion protein
VWIVRPGADGKPARVARTPVKIGPYGEDSVPVLEGVAATDWVVSAGAHLLREGQPVKPVDRHDRAIALVATPAPKPAAR